LEGEGKEESFFCSSPLPHKLLDPHVINISTTAPLTERKMADRRRPLYVERNINIRYLSSQRVQGTLERITDRPL